MITAASRSSLARICGWVFRRKTSHPRRRKVWAISQPMGPRPDDDEAGGPLGEVEDRFVGEKAGLRQSGDGGMEGPGPRWR